MSEFLRLLLATLLGAGVSFGTTLYFQQRIEALGRKRAEEADQRELRRALRLVHAELLENEAVIEIARGAETWWSFPPNDLSVKLWEEWRSTLADLLDDQGVWGYLSSAFGLIADLNLKLAMFRAGRRYPNEMASYLTKGEVFNEGWSEDHDGNISPQWDDLLMRTQVAVERGNRAVSQILFPGKSPPEVQASPSRFEAEERSVDPQE